MSAQRFGVYVDDLTGQRFESPAALRTVTVTVDGFRYDFDVTAEGREELNRALAPILAKSRRAYGRNGLGASKSSTPKVVDAAFLRSWAMEQGLPIAAVGRIPASIRERYKEATSGATPGGGR